MRAIVEEAATHHSPDSLAATLRHELGLVLLRTGSFDVPSARYSFVAARPFLTFQARGSRCETRFADGRVVEQYGNPWQHLAPLLAAYELIDQIDVPFPLGGGCCTRTSRRRGPRWIGARWSAWGVTS